MTPSSYWMCRTSADALLPLEMVYAFEPVPPEAPPPLDVALDDVIAASEAAPMSPEGGTSLPGDSEGDMECSAADGCAAQRPSCNIALLPDLPRFKLQEPLVGIGLSV